MDPEMKLGGPPKTPADSMIPEELESELAENREICEQIGNMVSSLHRRKDDFMHRQFDLKYALFQAGRPQDLLAHALRRWDSPETDTWCRTVDGRGFLEGEYQVARQADGTVEIRTKKLNSRSTQSFDSDQGAISWLRENLLNCVSPYPNHFYDRDCSEYFEARREGRSC